MSSYGLVITFAILGVLSASAAYLIPVLNEREIAVEVAEIQAAAAAFRDERCGALPASATLADLGLANPTSSLSLASWVIRFANQQGVIEATTADGRLGHMIARSGGGTRTGSVTTIPVRRPAALDRTSPEAHQMRRYFAGAETC